MSTETFETSEWFSEYGEKPLQKYNNIEEILTRNQVISPDMLDGLTEMVYSLIENTPVTDKVLIQQLQPLRMEFKISPKKSQILQVYRSLLNQNKIERNQLLEELLITKCGKSQSGIISITVLTSPFPSNEKGEIQKFSCKWDCFYCPNQPGQPRSYLRNEPAVLRANYNHFDAVMQFTDRCVSLRQNGHPIDKVELLVLGGTWTSYPLKYREDFCRDLYFAANTFHDICDGSIENMRDRKNLQEEKLINETALCKIIGLTLETRPDTINQNEMRLLRSYGCTRVQLGVQHTDDIILKKINRGHGLSETINAIKLLKNACFKIDVHLMPNLPFSSPVKDSSMFESMLNNEDLQVDQWKIYPCEITPWTKIKKWYDNGSYIPYSEENLIDLLCEVKSNVHPWIRLNRVVRDIPSHYIVGGIDSPSMREDVLATMRRKNLKCKCIRCREVGDLGGHKQHELSTKPTTNKKTSRMGRRILRTGDVDKINKWSLRTRPNREGVLARKQCEILSLSAVMKHRTYVSSGGVEHFISFETKDEETLFGFLRLRLSNEAGSNTFTSLKQCALIRELHVYGQLVPIKHSDATCIKGINTAQHRGFGKFLILDAERIARKAGFKKIAVIAGVGTRNYYRKLGFVTEGDGDFLVKHLTFNWYLALSRVFFVIMYTCLSGISTLIFKSYRNN
jgi:ELP3 family radical SAM enzyme/protein acetyltransferase